MLVRTFVKKARDTSVVGVEPWPEQMKETEKRSSKDLLRSGCSALITIAHYERSGIRLPHLQRRLRRGASDARSLLPGFIRQQRVSVAR